MGMFDRHPYLFNPILNKGAGGVNNSPKEVIRYGCCNNFYVLKEKYRQRMYQLLLLFAYGYYCAQKACDEGRRQMQLKKNNPLTAANKKASNCPIEKKASVLISGWNRFSAAATHRAINRLLGRHLEAGIGNN
ncbi:hypothetical protein CEXT_48651 [Caerostris extrusa]|uniref:Uncharacterized protein n=1 Tax=Caerostris extrusa TaxID=172846 RepID=A0AAV4N0S6_CAEEX|nr:hypothetical protein CEXT_48651 [Caerostris extrusa]